MSEPLRAYRFHGRRKGHALRRQHLRLMEELLPKVRFDGVTPKSPAWLEIGFGGGEHLAHQAELHREVSFIGAEPFINGVAKLLALIEAKGLGNIRIHDGDARELLETLPAGSLQRIHLLYPDPWPKARHRKRRLVSAATVEQFNRLLAPGGWFLFASDIADYVEWTREHVAAHGGWEEQGLPSEPFEGWTETRYEAKARRENRSSSYLKFFKTGVSRETYS